ncbi:MAG: DUF1189 domain-containing protein [Lachnospiraceae bacterium]|nr:DUF1189 domain-containing protein [Lachnospiraceae bacterium]
MYTKVNPFLQIIEAFKGVYSPESLYNLRKQSTGGKILYAIIVSILIAIIVCGWVVFTINTDEELENQLLQLPNFSYASGSFYVEEEIVLAADNSYLIINTNQEKWDLATLKKQAFETSSGGYKEFQKALDNSNATQIMLISQTTMVTYEKNTGEFIELPLYNFLNALGIRTFSKDIILDGYKGFVAKTGFSLGLFIVPFTIINLFFTTLFLALVALIINAVCKSNESFATLYWISFYVQSVLTIIRAIGSSMLSINDFRLSSICFIVYIVIMVRTLQTGDVTLRPATLYSLNDDLDDYLNNM